MATFRRHYAVLTNFIRNVMESRPYWPGGGERAQNQGVPGTGRTGPEGWVLGTRAGAAPQTTHSASLQEATGPASLSEAPLSRVLGDPVLPSRYTHPVPTYPYPAGTPARAVASNARVGSAPGTCTYDRF